MMKKLILLLLSTASFSYPKAGITYVVGTRLGDQLIHYCIAKDLALKHNLTFYYRPFKYSDELKLSEDAPLLTEQSFSKHTVIEIGHELPNTIDENSNILYVVGFKHWQVSSYDKQWYGINADSDFRQLLKKLIAPRHVLSTLYIDHTAVTVAMHVRVGEGYDSTELVASYYEKFPKEDFYIAAIKKIKHLFPGAPLYIYIFTDSYNPQALRKKYESLFREYRDIRFEARLEKQVAPWDQHVLEDLFKMAQFDCLIRPKSAYSVIAQVIGSHKIILYPTGEIIALEKQSK
jgi:hypothetical protein